MVSIKDYKYFVPFVMPILFFAVLMDWSIDGFGDIVFGIIPLLLFPAFLFFLPIYFFLYWHRKLKMLGRIKNNTPFVVSYVAVVLFDLLLSGFGAIDTYKGVSGSALNGIMLFYLPFLNIFIIVLLYIITQFFSQQET